MISLDVIDIIEKLNSQNSSRFLPNSLNSHQSLSSFRPRRSPTIGSDIYDGLVSSTNISNFNISLQSKLRIFYNYLKEENYDMLSNIALSTLDDIEEFKDQNVSILNKIKERLS